MRTLDRTGGERLLRLACRGDGTGRSRERDEECVSLCVDLDAFVPSERLAHDPSMLGQRVGV